MSNILNQRGDKAQIEAWIQDARSGSGAALGSLIESYRNYLLAIASRQLPQSLKAKLGASDLVQETSMDAHRDFSSFKGDRRDELLAWLRQILLHNAANVDRDFRLTSKRQISREVALGDGTDIVGGLQDSSPTPSGIAESTEVKNRVEQAISRLPENMRTAVLLRNRDHLAFGEIGERMQCSADAARKLWARAIEKLQGELGQVNGGTAS